MRSRRRTAAEPKKHGQLVWLYARIAEFDEIDRSLILMFLDGFTYAEISAALGISESNVGAKMHRLKSRLARLVEQDQAT